MSLSFLIPDESSCDNYYMAGMYDAASLARKS